jgi:hypothetical protein
MRHDVAVRLVNMWVNIIVMQSKLLLDNVLESPQNRALLLKTNVNWVSGA